MARVVVHLTHRDLVRAPVVLRSLSVDLRGTGPALRGAQDDHGPAWARAAAVTARVVLDPLDVRDDRVERLRHELMHSHGLVALDEVGGVAVTAEQLVQLLVADPGQDGGIGDLVAVEMQDRQDHAVRHRAQELVGMPARRQRPRLRLAVADHAGDDEVRVVERGPVRMRDRVPQLAPLVHRAGSFRRHVARNPAGERELGEETLHALLVRGDIRIDLAVGSFQIGVRDQAGPAVPRPGDVEHVEIVFLDHAVQVGIDEVQAGRGAPVPEEPRLDVLLRERLLEQRVVIEIDLADRQVVGGAPVRIDEREFLVRERASHDALLMIRMGLHVRRSPGDGPGGSSLSVVVHLMALRRARRDRLHVIGVSAETGGCVAPGPMR